MYWKPFGSASLSVLLILCIAWLLSDESDLDRMFRLPPITFIGGENPELPLREIVNRLEVSNLLKLNLINSHF